MPTWDQLTQWNPAPLRDAEKDLKSIAETIHRTQESLETHKFSEDGWTGNAADAAWKKAQDYVSAFEGLANEITKLSEHMRSTADKVAEIQNQVEEAQHYASSHNLFIGSNGTVTAATAIPLDSNAVEWLTEQIRRIQERASQISQLGLPWLQGFRTFVLQLGTSLIQDKMANRIASKLSSALTKMSPMLVGQGALAGGGVTDIPIVSNPGAIKAAGYVMRYGAVGIGAALDFSGQMADVSAGKQDVGDAVIKTASHTAIGIGSAAAAGAIVGSVIPGAGTLVGAAAGAVIGAGISIVGCAMFDAGYDHVGGWKGVGDAVTKFFSPHR
ncbi:MAG: hypothetical protein CSA83_01155 [Actinomycetales bacterium]|nr:MAG: hypothetical protein CSA83_01155 [Actinomycetales bacterium]